MSLLDGKYEIIAHRPLADRQTLFEATAPDGTLLTIVWYDLTPEQEPAFEHYRRLLKRLKRSELTALYDVVSRPGARYVAWECPPEGSGAGRHPELERLLVENGAQPEHADIRRDGRRARLYGLAFGGVPQRAPELLPPRVRPDARTERTARRPVPTPLLSWGGSAALLLLAFLLLLGGMRRNANDRVVQVPDLRGSPVNDVITALWDLGFTVIVHEVAAEAVSGSVVEISPAPGSSLRPGRSVEVGYALPPGSFAPTALPQLVGRTHPGDAEPLLRAAGLELGDVARIPADVPGGVIIAQSPAAGAVIEQGTQVDILVSAGPLAAATFLPDLVGMNEEDARYFAELAGLRPDRIVVDRVALAGTESGTVVSQSLAPNQVLAQDTTLRLVVSDGLTRAGPPASDGVPSFIGLTREQAEARARAAGLTPRFSERGVEMLPEGVVLQTPEPGGERGGGEILLVLNIHPQRIPVPEVTVEVRPPEPRSIDYRWIVEAGIPEVTAVVTATTLDGTSSVVARRRIQGGEMLEGVWRTEAAGPVSLSLTLNGSPYGEVLRR